MKKTQLHHDGSCSRTHLEESHNTMLNPHQESSLNIERSCHWLFDKLSITLTTTLNKITLPDIRSRPYRVEPLRKTEWLMAPRPEERASGPPKSSANQRRGQNDAGVNPFPFPLGVGTINSQGKTCFKYSFGKISRVKILDQESQRLSSPLI